MMIFKLEFIAMAPDFVVFNSFPVFFLFSECSLVPTVVVAVYRKVIPKNVGLWCLICILCSNFPIVFALRDIYEPDAMYYWTSWCSTLAILSFVFSFCFLRRKRVGREGPER